MTESTLDLCQSCGPHPTTILLFLVLNLKMLESNLRAPDPTTIYFISGFLPENAGVELARLRDREDTRALPELFPPPHHHLFYLWFYT